MRVGLFQTVPISCAVFNGLCENQFLAQVNVQHDSKCILQTE